jgi:hypothetical protein
MGKIKQWNTYKTKGIKKESLYRYMSLDKLISLLTTKSIYMPTMDRFDDKLEGISTYDITELQVHYETCFIDREEEIAPAMLNDWKVQKEISASHLKAISKKMIWNQKAHYVSCWFCSNRESDGMWRNYAKEDGFAIKVDRKQFQKKVKESININTLSPKQNIIVGRVKYQDFPRVIENEQENTVLYLAFRKDESFQHEKEYRIVLVDKNVNDKPNHFSYKLENFEELNITIIAHPAMKDDVYLKAKAEFEALGEHIKVQKSELEPFYQLVDRVKEL